MRLRVAMGRVSSEAEEQLPPVPMWVVALSHQVLCGVSRVCWIVTPTMTTTTLCTLHTVIYGLDSAQHLSL